MTEQVSIAKITKPTISDIFQRERLFRLLDNNRKRPIIWVTGPAGSGKTTLVAGYLDSRHLPCLWYRMDQADADMATFFYYLGLAANKISPPVNNLPLLTPEYLQGIPVFTKRFFEQLCSGLEAPFVLVFDNYQDVPDASGLHEMIVHGLDAVPEGVTVIVVSRKEPPPQFARLRADNKCAPVGWEEIRFTLDEYREVARLYGQGNLADETLVEIHNRTQGWMAGLVLIMEGSKKTKIDPSVLGKLMPETIFDYFACEIFEKTDNVRREFLQKTAFLPAMTSQMAEKLTGIQASEEILSQLHKSHYFIEMRAGENPVYQYHPLFREFLLTRARGFLGREEIFLIRQRAAALLEKSGQIEHAALLLRDAEDWKGLVRLILRHAQSLAAQGRGKTLQEWLTSFPGEIVETTPWLLYWLGTCKMPFNLIESRADLERAFHAFKQQKDPAGLYLSWSGIINTFIYELGDFTPLDHWVSEVETLLRDYPEFPSREIEARVTYGMFSAIMHRQPQHPDLHLWEERMRKVVLSSTDIRLQATIGNQLIIYYTWVNGDLAKAAFLIDVLKSVAQSRDIDPLSFIVWRTFEAAYYWTTASHEDCLKVVNEGLKMAEETGIHFWDSVLWAFGAMTNTTAGNLKEAQRFLDKMPAAMNPTAYGMGHFYHYSSAFVALFRGDLAGALEHAQNCLVCGLKSGMPFTIASDSFALGTMLLEHDEREKGLAYLADARRIGASIKSNTAVYLSYIGEALYFLKQKETERGLDALEKAMAIGRRQGFWNNSAWRPSAMSFLCAKALEAGIEVDYVQELIRKRGLVPDASAINIENWPWTLRIYTLGQFRIEKDGTPLTFSGKVQKKPLELLKILIALGGRDVSERKVTDALWPDAEGDAAHHAFVTALQRLRALLGSKEAVQHQGGRLSLDPRYCWVDALAFESLVRKADEAWKAGKKKQALLITEKAVALYRGPLLGQDGDEHGITTFRESLRKKFMRSLGALGHHAEHSGEWEKALAYYDRVPQLGD